MANIWDRDRKVIIKKIVKLFDENVRNKCVNHGDCNEKHDGKDGHWLERQMGIKANASNTPDLFGFEMKNDTGSKTSFGDWSANYYIFKDNEYGISRDDFFNIFGKPNEKKGGRPSWSGEPIPKINRYNSFGQILEVDKQNNIFAVYSFDKDQRANKKSLVPFNLQKNDLILAKWDAESIKLKLERKFDELGWFKCLKDKNGIYQTIVFGGPITFKKWIMGVKSGLVYFDSGMYSGNFRPYSQWRAGNAYWNSLIIDRF